MLLARAREEGTIPILDFYAGRARRLLPAHALVLAATLSLGLFLLPRTGELQALAGSALASLAFLSNIYFWLTLDRLFRRAVRLDTSTEACAISRQVHESRQASIEAATRAAIEGKTHVEYWSHTSTLCPGDLCLPLVGDVVMYCDTNPLSFQGAMSMLLPQPADRGQMTRLMW
jgi:hypothetical protein